MSKESPTIAEKFIEFHRRRFIGLYPSKLHFILNMTHKDAYRWNADGLIECECDYTNQPLDVTDDGWQSLNLGGPTPYSWQSPDTRGVIFNIPENAHKDWLDELSSLIYFVNKVSDSAMNAYIDGCYGIQSMGQEYRDNYAKSSKENFHKLKALLQERQVEQRICRILRERYEKTLPPRPPEVKEGSVVRVASYEDTAEVIEIIRVRGYDLNMETCVLSKPIGGTRFWGKGQCSVAA